MLLRSAICIALFGIPAVALHAQDAGWARVYGASAAALDQAGIGSQRQRDYGGFVWVRLNADERERLARAGLRVETDPRAGRIMLGERSFDPLTDAPEAAATPPLSPAGYGLWLIQLDAPLKGEWAQALESAGIATLQYVPANVLLVWGRAAEVSAARSQSWVRWAGAYTPSFRSAAALRAATGTVSGLEVFFYAGADADGVRSALAALGARVDYVQRAQPEVALRLLGSARRPPRSMRSRRCPRWCLSIKWPSQSTTMNCRIRSPRPTSMAAASRWSAIWTGWTALA